MREVSSRSSRKIDACVADAPGRDADHTSRSLSAMLTVFMSRHDSIAANIAHWTKNNRERLDDGARVETWAEGDLRWGIFGIREADLGSPLGDVHGLDVIELGCGTAYFSARLAKRGARPVGVDPTPAQLATARRMQDATGIRFPLIEAPGERVPQPDA